MRISTDQQYASLQRSIARAEARMADLQRQLASGKRLNRPSDDPLAAMSALTFRSARSHSIQHAKNAEGGKVNMQLADNALAEMNEVMKRAQTLAISAANAPTSQEGREAMAREISRLQERLVELANTRNPNGDFLFAGQEIKTKPFTAGGGTVTYNGDTDLQFVEVGPGFSIPKNMIVDELVTEAFAALEDARNRMEGGDLSGISGVSLQLIENVGAKMRTARGEAGVGVQRFSEAASTAARRVDDLTVWISEREDADIAEVVVNLQAAQTTYQAALAAFSSSHQTSLLHFIR